MREQEIEKSGEGREGQPLPTESHQVDSWSTEGWPIEALRAWDQRPEEARAPFQLRGAEAETLSLFIGRAALDEAACSASSITPQLFVTPTQPEAEALGLALAQLLAGAGQVKVLPELPIPYEQLALERQQEGELLAWCGAARLDRLPPFTVMSAATWSRKVLAPESIDALQLSLEVGHLLDREAAIEILTRLGYSNVKLVRAACSFAIRGSLLDIYPPQLSAPIRVDFWDEEIESIHPFDPKSQRRLGDELSRVDLPPVRSAPLCEPHLGLAIDRIKALEAERQIDPLVCGAAIDDLNNSLPFPGMIGAWPLFHKRPAVPLWSLIPARTRRIFVDPARIREVCVTRWARWEKSYEEVELGRSTIGLPPDQLQSTPKEVDQAFQAQASIYAHQLQLGGGGAETHRLHLSDHQLLRQRLEITRESVHPLAPLEASVSAWIEAGFRVCLCWGSAAQRDRLALNLEALAPTLLDSEGRLIEGDAGEEPARATETEEGALSGLLVSLRTLEAGLYLLPGPIRRGFVAPGERLVLVSAAEILSQPPPVQGRVGAAEAGQDGPFIRQLDDLDRGDYVVHLDFGIGRFLGIEARTDRGYTNDYIIIQFAEEDKLLLPITRLHQLQRYIGPNGKAPKLKRLGSKHWQKSKAEAERQAQEQAQELLALYAARASTPGYAYAPPDDLYRTFEAGFPYRETPDQAKAIREVIQDLCAPRPMDRLLCGDVGFGKTEVAMRAAMKALLDGRQVAVLVPTTVLAAQHEKSFRARFQGTPARIGQLSRFNTSSQKKLVRERLAAGELDIVIGTHALIQRSIQFKNLGLLILDEEHRFGVKQKERLKALRAEVDVLSMTATPIPRTLQLSLNGIRDMSLITTPPRDRLPIETHVCRTTDGVVREAVLRELGRGGQVFFVHNRVQSIENRKAWLSALVPEARIVVAHGQLDPQALEEIMVNFTEGAYHILLTTTIIETGIDLPKVNTIIIDRAHELGLAQLYQLRGRVGRSTEQAACYLLVPIRAELSAEARQRLGALQKFTELGSGFQIASHDLEQRGAGDVLGLRQKGACKSLGVELYSQLLERAVKALQGNKEAPPTNPRLTLRAMARIPEEYLPDAHDRFVLYRRLSAAQGGETLDALEAEIRDRFGEPPPLLLNLLYTIRIRNHATKIFALRVEQVDQGMTLQLAPHTPLPLDRLLRLLQDPKSGYSSPKDYHLSYRWRGQEGYDPLRTILRCLQRLSALLPT